MDDLAQAPALALTLAQALALTLTPSALRRFRRYNYAAFFTTHQVRVRVSHRVRVRVRAS